MIDSESYASTHVLVPDELAEKIRTAAARISKEDLAEPGIETDSHVTLLYGIVSDDPSLVAARLQKFTPFSMLTTGISLFERPEYDVLKIDVISPGASMIHDSLRVSLENKWEWPNYQPHITIAYLQKGAGRRYCVPGILPGFYGHIFSAGEVVFTDSKDKKTILELGSKT